MGAGAAGVAHFLTAEQPGRCAVTFLKTYALVPVILVGLTSLVLLFYPNWRWTLLAVAVQYLAVAWLVGLSWPVGLAAIKLVVGWMAGRCFRPSRPTPMRHPKPLSGTVVSPDGRGLAVGGYFHPSIQHASLAAGHPTCFLGRDGPGRNGACCRSA